MQRVPKSVHNSVNFCTPAATAYADTLMIFGFLRILEINRPLSGHQRWPYVP